VVSPAAEAAWPLPSKTEALSESLLAVTRSVELKLTLARAGAGANDPAANTVAMVPTRARRAFQTGDQEESQDLPRRFPDGLRL
jgi:hypothetical protein